MTCCCSQLPSSSALLPLLCLWPLAADFRPFFAPSKFHCISFDSLVYLESVAAVTAVHLALNGSRPGAFGQSLQST